MFGKSFRLFKLLGCVTAKQIKDIPKEEWNQRTVGEVAKDCSTDNSISPQADAIKALSTMKRTGNSRLMVVENSHLVGVVALKDMLNYLSLKVELEES
jgi:CBS domain-containing protein